MNTFTIQSDEKLIRKGGLLLGYNQTPQNPAEKNEPTFCYAVLTSKRLALCKHHEQLFSLAGPELRNLPMLFEFSLEGLSVEPHYGDKRRLVVRPTDEHKRRFKLRTGDGGQYILQATRLFNDAPRWVAMIGEATSQAKPQTLSTPPITSIEVKCGGCHRLYQIGADAAVVTSENVGSDFGRNVSGGNKADPDFVAPYSPGRSPSDDVRRAVQMLLCAKNAGAERYWKCNPCGTVNRYSW